MLEFNFGFLGYSGYECLLKANETQESGVQKSLAV